MKVKQVLKTILGFLALGLGFLGLFVPLWPTTPFVLLSIWCFASLPKLRDKILKIKFVSEYYYCYTQKSPIRLKTKLLSLVFLWAMLILSMFLIKKPRYYYILGAVGVAVTAHILYIASGRRTKSNIAQEEEK